MITCILEAITHNRHFGEPECRNSVTFDMLSHDSIYATIQLCVLKLSLIPVCLLVP
jgi:hypothetical protein